MPIASGTPRPRCATMHVRERYTATPLPFSCLGQPARLRRSASLFRSDSHRQSVPASASIATQNKGPATRTVSAGGTVTTACASSFAHFTTFPHHARVTRPAPGRRPLESAHSGARTSGKTHRLVTATLSASGTSSPIGAARIAPRTVTLRPARRYPCASGTSAHPLADQHAKPPTSFRERAMRTLGATGIQ
jgi:hypothetical protein